MKALLIPAYYLAWHYTSAVGHLLSLYRNSIFFIYNFFSIKVLLRTIFRPLRRIEYEERHEENEEDAIVTVVMAIVGFVVRTVVIICGFLSSILVFAIWAAVFIFWLALPFLAVLLFFFGLLSFLQ